MKVKEQKVKIPDISEQAGEITKQLEKAIDDSNAPFWLTKAAKQALSGIKTLLEKM